MNSESLQQRLNALRRRASTLATFTGVGWGLLTALAVWLVFVWFDLLWELSPPVRIAANLLAAIAAVAGLAIVVWRARRESRAAALARRLDAVGGAGGQIRSGYDLAVAGHGAAMLPLTQGLAQLAIARASQLASAVLPWRVVPSRPLRMTIGSLAAACAAVAALALAMPRLAETQWLRFSDPLGDHPPYSQVQFTVNPGDTEVLYGHELEVKVATEGPPVEQVELVLPASDAAAEEAEPMFLESDGHWRGVLTKVLSPTQYFVRAGRSRSRRFDLGVITIPKLESVRFRVTQPAYTRRPVYDGPLPQTGLAGLKGTKVEVWAKSNRPLTGGGVIIYPLRELAALNPVAGDPQQVTGSFEIRANGKIEIAVTAVAGHASEEKFAAAVTLLKDESPFVRILQPPPVSMATPQATLPAALSAEDDYGISRVQLFRSLNDSRAMPLDFPLPNPPPLRYDGSEALPLSAYGLAPGDVIKLFARVEDNDPDGAKGSESPVVEVRIISQDEFERMLREREGLEVLMSKYQAAERRLEELQKSQEGLRKKMKQKPEEKLPDSAREDLKLLAQQLQQDADETRQGAERLLPYDVDHKLSKQLSKLADKMATLAKEASDLENEQSLSREDLEKLLDKLAKELGDDRGDLDKQALDPLDALDQIFPLIEDQSRFEELYRQQRDLAERLASLKGHDHQDNPAEKARMRDLENQQRRIRESLDQLLGDIEDHVQQLPDDKALDGLRESAKKFVEAVKNSGAADAMTEAESGLSEFSGTKGHAGAKKAADALEKLLTKGSSMDAEGRSACLVFRPGLGAILGNTIDQLLGERGLRPGSKSGSGGYGMRSNSAKNVGLYGQMPGIGQAHGQRDRRAGQRGQGVGLASGQESNPLHPDKAGGADGSNAAGGSGGMPVPLRYRSRVAAYLERIQEEQSDEKNQQ